MFRSWRWQLREARMAWRGGRVDEAGALLAAKPLCEFLPAKRLAGDVAATIIERARERLARGDSAAGWRDLTAADRLAGQTEATEHLRRQYVDRTLREVDEYLLASEPAAALTRLARLDQRGIFDATARRLQQIAQSLHDSQRLADHGHFGEAVAAQHRAAALAHSLIAARSTMEDLCRQLDEQGTRLAERQSECQRLNAEMHSALTNQDWLAVLVAADALLAIAPEHAAARQSRRRAWKAVGLEVTLSHRTRRAADVVSLDVGMRAGQRGMAGDKHGRQAHTPAIAAAGEVDTMPGHAKAQRGLLWVDAVGGFLVCLDDCIILGQPAGGEAIGVPIMADLSRRHATIRREASAYILQSSQRVCVDGRPIDGPCVLADNQVIQLGEGVQLRFSKPHALSATARLSLESNHRTQPSADGVLLMADSIVLGSNRHCHVQCRDWGMT